MEKHIDPAKKHDFVYLFDVEMGNPNGDPDAGNLPRMDPQTGKGIVTDVCLKRKIRDYVQLTQSSDRFKIFIQSETALNTLIEQTAKDTVGFEPPKADLDTELADYFRENLPEDFELDDNILIFRGEEFDKRKVKKILTENVQNQEIKRRIEAVGDALAKAAKGKLGTKERIKTRQEMINRYFDIRLFGAVLTTGINAGQVKGPMQLTFAQSVHPIFPMDIGITRIAITREEDKKRKETEMGRKPLIPYGLYIARGFYNPFLGGTEKGTGVTEKDLEVFWKALLNMFEFSRSASKGLMNCRGLYIFSHESEYGNAPSHKLFDLVNAKLTDEVKEKNTPPRSFGDYDITVGDAPKGISIEKML